MFANETGGPRSDLRLVPAALLAWAAALAGAILPFGATAAIAGFLVAAAGIAIGLRLRHDTAPGTQQRVMSTPPSRLDGRLGGRNRKREIRWRSFNQDGPPVSPQVRRGSWAATLALACVAASAVAAHSAVGGLLRNEGPLADSVDAGTTAVAELIVTGSPRATGPAGAGGTGERWSVQTRMVSLSAGGRNIESQAGLVVTGGEALSSLLPGDRIRTMGRLKEQRPGQPEAGVLVAGASPRVQSKGGEPLKSGPAALRAEFRETAGALGGDAAGLLPGMVTGDTQALDESLSQAMKTVGMTHLTAVSGANCSLVLGCLLLVARTLRLPRPAALAAALAGLAWFVLMVGPDASVLRAAAMGAIGLASLSTGRRGRTLGFLCLAVIGLLVVDPLLGVSYGFLLSVAATLGIVLLGSRLARWLGHWLPKWLAVAISIPLAAQVFCSPIIVALQPGYSPYALVANVAAAPFVGPVTVLGTAAVPLLGVPWAATALIWVSGVSAGAVAALARLFAGLPGSELPWPEGVIGMATMLLSSVLSLAAVWAATHLLNLVAAVRRLHIVVVSLLGLTLEHREGRRSVPVQQRGRLRHCNNKAGRTQPWLLPKTRDPRARR